MEEMWFMHWRGLGERCFLTQELHRWRNILGCVVNVVAEICTAGRAVKCYDTQVARCVRCRPGSSAKYSINGAGCY